MKTYLKIATVLVAPVLILAGFSSVSNQFNSNVQAVTTPVVDKLPVAAAPAPISVDPALTSMQSDFEQIYNTVNPSVVNIQVVINNTSSNQSFQGSPFGFSSPQQQAPQEALGSGFVWDTQGHIVTNNHVVAGADKITVYFPDGSSADAKLVGADPNADLAVIQVNVPTSQLFPVQMADSTQVKVGQIAIAIGNPYGLSGTMTTGIVSGLSRSLPVGLDSLSGQNGPVYSIPDIIQTDAAINPGNSGGVLVNTEAQVMGVTAAIRSSTNSNSGIGFVIPASIVQRVVPALIAQGHYDHPWLGISGTSLDSDLAQAMKLDANQKGVLVVDVSPNSPADKAGLMGSTTQVTINGQTTVVGGDIITAIDGSPIQKFEDLSSYLINNTQVGQTVTLTILRQGKEQAVKLTLGTLPLTPGQ
jgi:S1-C subfamily serine protease